MGLRRPAQRTFKISLKYAYFYDVQHSNLRRSFLVLLSGPNYSTIWKFLVASTAGLFCLTMQFNRLKWQAGQFGFKDKVNLSSLHLLSRY